MRPDGIETDVAMVLEKLVTKVEGQEVRPPREGGGGLGWGRGWGRRGGVGAAAGLKV